MPDLYQSLAEAPEATVRTIADSLERRAGDPAQQEILETYIADLAIAPDSAVLEIGCGTGPVCRRFAELPDVARVVGVDPAPLLIDRAREIADGDPRLEFQVARGDATGLADGAFDGVVLHTLLSHVPDQPAILAEAHRLLKPGGWLAVCDADFSKTSAAIGSGDPLQACVDAWVEHYVTDRWLIPRLPGLLAAAGFEVGRFRGYNRADITGRSSAPLWIERGVNALVEAGTIGAELGAALKDECRRRIDSGGFYAALPFASVVASRP